MVWQGVLPWYPKFHSKRPWNGWLEDDPASFWVCWKAYFQGRTVKFAGCNLSIWRCFLKVIHVAYTRMMAMMMMRWSSVMTTSQAKREKPWHGHRRCGGSCWEGWRNCVWFFGPNKKCLNMFEEQERKMTKKIVPLDFSRVVFSVQRLGQLWARRPKSGERTSFFYRSFHVFSIGSCNLVPALCRVYQNFRS